MVFTIKKKLSQNNQILKYLDRVPKSELGIIKFTEVFARDKNTFFMVMNNPQEKKIEIFPFSNETQLTLKSQHLGKKTKFYFESEESLKSLNKPVEFSVSDGMNSEKIFINLSETPVKENVIKFLFFAFIGGIILNFMPCVFPVLSIKVMSMIQLKEVEKLQIKKFSFLVISGITFSFIFLAITLISLKSLGIFVGWGFQFQNIYFLIFLSLIILLFSLNLLGFFEIILPNSLSNFFDKLGRKVLMYIGSIGYIISLSLISLSFILEWGGIALPIFLFLFIASHAIGQGAIIWVYISEIFPNHIRSYGQSFGISTHWVLAAIIPSFVPFLFCSNTTST